MKIVSSLHINHSHIPLNLRFWESVFVQKIKAEFEKIMIFFVSAVLIAMLFICALQCYSSMRKANEIRLWSEAKSQTYNTDYRVY